MDITLLSPTWDQAVAAKTFALGPDRKPTLKKAYKLGEWFKYKEFKLTDIEQFFELLKKVQDKRVIRIYGSPVEGLGEVVQRRKINFSRVSTDLILIDADGWRLPQGYSIRNSKELHRGVQHLLFNVFHYDFLKDCDYVCLLSSSTWSRNVLRAHLYFHLNQPVKLSTLSSWALAHNTKFPEYKFDFSLFREVQPDFIVKRKCEGFIDPIPDELRLSLWRDIHKTVDRQDFTNFLSNFVKKSTVLDEWDLSTNKLVELPIKDNWLETLKLCGTQVNGINDPAYRACAQLVNEVGTSKILENLPQYVEKIFHAMWNAIRQNGVRGDKNDREVYDRNKIKGYLLTAANKNFGAKQDSKTQKIFEVISSICNGGSPSLLFDRDIIEAITNLKKSDSALFVEVRNRVKTELKGKVSIADFDSVLRSQIQAHDKAHCIEAVIGSLNWLRGSNDGGLYCRINRTEGYQLVPLSGAVDKFLFESALALGFGDIYKGFEADVMKIVTARELDSVFSPFKEGIVATRCYTAFDNKKFITYYNMGWNEDNEAFTTIIDENGVRIQPSRGVIVNWKTSKKTLWAGIDEHKDVLELFGATGEDIIIEDFLKKLRRFVRLEDDMSYVDLVSWMVVCVMGYGTANILELVGPSGTGKTTTALICKEICDPSSHDIRMKGEVHNNIYKREEMAKVLSGAQITIFDNLGNLKPFEQDMLCTIATGWTWEERILYTQDRASYHVKNPVILTSLSNVVTQQDLKSRTVTLNVCDTGVPNNNIIEDFLNMGAYLRGGLLHIVSRVIRILNSRAENGGDLSSRNLVLDAARTAIMQVMYPKKSEEEAKFIVKTRRLINDADEAKLNSRIVCYVIWMEHCSLLRHDRIKWYTTHSLYRSFADFISENVGNEFEVLGDFIRFNMYREPDTIRAFGRNLSAYARAIFAATGWEIVQHRQGGRRGWSIGMNETWRNKLLSQKSL